MLTFLLLASLAFPAASAADKTIYGADNRLDFYEVSSPAERAAMTSAVSIFRDSALEADGGSFRVKGALLGSEKRRLCPGQRFFSQRSAAYCSGTLVAPDLVLTAGHCMREKEDPSGRCGTARFVFGFALEKEGGLTDSVRAADVYSCSKVELHSYGTGGDYAVVRLDRPVSGRRPAVTGPGPSAGAPIFTVGGPYGLPLKVLNGAAVRYVEEDGIFFGTDLDTSGGNSGGGVFSAATGRLIGVHAASRDPDLVLVDLPAGHGLPPEDQRVKEGKCKIITVLGQDDGRGKRGVSLGAIKGLGQLLRGGARAADMPAVEVESALRPDLSRFGSLP